MKARYRCIRGRMPEVFAPRRSQALWTPRDRAVQAEREVAIIAADANHPLAGKYLNFVVTLGIIQPRNMEARGQALAEVVLQRSADPRFSR